ncbi:host specificity protein J [Providencia rustigianii]|uniref:host specificity protein J n=1 Tax=Providencia rustigianii TaxID=158850 RepID=UPI00223EF639|nr:phage tail protein [Providencia rustigianii]
METIYGAKGGGGGGHTPVEAKDNLLSESTAKILLAISEGEIAGGLDDTRIFLDDTPIGNTDGTKNFEGVTWEFRPGSEQQEYIKGIPSVDNEVSVGMELKHDQPYVKTFNNTQLSAVRVRFSIPQLMRQHDNGDTTGYRIEYAIDLSTDGAGYQELIKSAFDGKTTSEYQRTHRIDLPEATTGWQLRVRRLTPNQNTARIADKVMIAAVTEVIDAKLRYPNTALLFVTFNARQFNNRIPKVSIRPKGGLLIKVPTNYDPVNRTYSGVWDGTFKLAATNNPAWVFYDLVLNNRYGCGDRINANQIEKWDLYKIAQYCDELVPDGRGGDGKEPRFLCDVYIQSQEAAYTVLRDIAAIFRGMIFWADNKVNAIADMPAPLFRTFTNANIVGGKPSYSGGSIQNRYTQALVSFTDTDNHSHDDIEAVVDLQLQRRYGVRKTELSAIGCTRRSEANRRGRWALLTNANDRMITFATGLEGAIPSPSHIIAVADSNLAGRETGGRIAGANGRNITLDRVTSIKEGDRLIINLPDGRSEGRTVTAVNNKIVTVSVGYSQVPQKDAVWVVDSDDLAVQLYRVINISDNGDNTYTISGAAHNPDNYEHIDSGARIDERPVTIIPPSVQPAPSSVKISSYSIVDQGIAFSTLSVSWDAAESAIAYEAQWRRDNGNWINVPRTSSLGFEVNGIYSGRYQVRVRAINAAEISSVWANAPETSLTGKVGNPPKPVNFRASSLVFGIKLDWGFDENTSDTLKTEIQYSKTHDGHGVMLLADVPYPSRSHEITGLAAGTVFYFRARLVDKSGNESEWTSFVRGESEFDVNSILPDLSDQFMSTEAGKQLADELDWLNDSVKSIDAGIVKLDKAIIDLNQSFAESQKQVQAKFENQAAMINTKMQAQFSQGSGYAMHSTNITIMVDGKKYNAASMVVSAEVKGGQIESYIGFNANNFAFFNPTRGKMEPLMFMRNGQIYMRESFIADASISNAKIGNVIQSNNFISGKSGWSINKDGNAEFNAATFRGRIDGADGYFKGTVYVDKLIGDNATATVYKEVSKSETHGSNYDQIIETSIIYQGGMPYDVDLLMPTMQFTSEGSVPGAIRAAYVEVIINGVKYSPQTTVIGTEKNRSLICSLYVTLKAAMKEVRVTIRYITNHKNGCKTRIHPAMIIACKHNSSSFQKI